MPAGPMDRGLEHTAGAGEVPVAAVQLDTSVSVTEGELQQLGAPSEATCKQQRHVLVVDSIPRLPPGKVLRRTLREHWAPAWADAGAAR